MRLHLLTNADSCMEVGCIITEVVTVAFVSQPPVYTRCAVCKTSTEGKELIDVSRSQIYRLWLSNYF